MATAPNVNYNAGYNPYQTQAKPVNYNTQNPNFQNPQAVQTKAQAPLSHIPYQQDVLSLSTKPDSNSIQNVSKDNNLSLDTKNNETNNDLNSSLQAQMPAPDIKTDSKDAVQASDNSKENEEKPLPSLNIGVVDAPNNNSLTPITDDLNSRAGEIEYPASVEVQKNNESQAPQSLWKKPFNAGKLSAGLMFGSFAIISAMLIPKGITKVAKLIKHIKHK